ncbi:hypothetical protein [Pedobacter sp. Leaf170]|uniref:hypothetical protein n=1 Tax=Pedobacter sp. Leaf170 TaxID=2876558 RepID=UPI001E28B5C6|nr:hypothetical protein [Pedobacter sp. Leaf170]
MKKVFLVLAVILSFGFYASAQTEGAVRKISVGAEFATPDRKNSNQYSVGGSIQFEQPVAKSLNLTASAGYLRTTYTDGTKAFMKTYGYPTNWGSIPVKIGAKYYFGGNFYGAGEVGAAFSVDSSTKTGFIYAPTLGTSFSISKKSNLDVGIRYETFVRSASSGSFGIRAAYSFGF